MDILGIYGITIMGNEKEVLMWGHHGILVLCYLLHNNTCDDLKLKCWVCFIMSTQGTKDRRVMGAIYWSHSYRK